MVFLKSYHNPKSFDTLPVVKKPDKRPSLEDDMKELHLLKRLIIDDDETVIEELAALRHLSSPAPIDKQQLLNDYRYSASYYSKFRLMNDDLVSYRNGFFYKIDENPDTIINFDTESTPAMFSGMKLFDSAALRQHHMSNCINMLSCSMLKPSSITFHTPNK